MTSKDLGIDDAWSKFLASPDMMSEMSAMLRSLSVIDSHSSAACCPALTQEMLDSGSSVIGSVSITQLHLESFAYPGCFQARRIKVAIDEWDKTPFNLCQVIQEQIEVNQSQSPDLKMLQRCNGDAGLLGRYSVIKTFELHCKAKFHDPLVIFWLMHH